LNLFGAWNLVLEIYLRRNVAADPWSAKKVIWRYGDKMTSEKGENPLLNLPPKRGEK